MIALALVLACSSVESPDRDTLFDLDGPRAAAAGAGIAGGAALVVAFAGAGLTTVSPVFVLLPVVATAGLPIAAGLSAVWAASLSESAVSVGLGTGAGVLAGWIAGGAAGLAAGSFAGEGGALLGAWIGAMLAGTAGGALAAAVTTTWAE